jgi:tetratricopeptide (TPR) repeat protein
MRTCTLNYKTLVGAVLAGLIGVATPVVASTPTVGGEAAFATRADGMASTVEGFLEAKDYDAAEKAARELTETNPGYLKGWMLLGYCQSLNEHFAESNVSYNKALELGAEANPIHMRMAYNHLRLQSYDQARACYRKVLELDYDNPAALEKLGYLEARLGNYDEAAHYYRRILEKHPDNAEVIAALTKVEEKRGGNGVVKELLEKSLALNPDDTEALASLGRIYIKDKNYSQAVEPLSRLITLAPDDVKAHHNLAVACTHFNTVKSLGGDMSDLYGPLADCYVESGDKDNALSVIKEGIEAGYQEAWLYCMWGKVLEKDGRYDAAMAKFSNAASAGEEPWSTYAKKQIARQAQLKQRAEMIAEQQGTQ